MTREDIKKHFPEATEEQISGLLDINSKDIGKHKTAAETASIDLKKANRKRCYYRIRIYCRCQLYQPASDFYGCQRCNL